VAKDRNPPRQQPARQQERTQSIVKAGRQLQSADNEKADPALAKIFPRNLTARAAYLVPGNPSVTRPEDSPANCYPGLEIDVRNLDRRFFPGLVFNFVEVPGGPHARDGAKLSYVDIYEDPDLQLDLESTLRRLSDLGISEQTARTLYSDIDGYAEDLGKGNWYLDWIKVGRSRPIEMYASRLIGKARRRRRMNPLRGLVVWRLIRGLEAGPVSIGLKRRDVGHKNERVTLHGWRRLYTDPDTGVISAVYKPGELMQGLCSPWQHDFRDCYCHYWASNRPDLVLADVDPGEPVLPDGSAVDPSKNIRLDWMRANRSPALAVKAFGIIEQNRPYQFDHYQINSEWLKLNMVLEGRELDSEYSATASDDARPYDSVKALADDLRNRLIGLEMTLVYEYLYARFSLQHPDEVGNKALADALTLARDNLLLIAISEMQHMAWGNELLWRLCEAEKIAYQPVTAPTPRVPTGHGPKLGERPRRGPVTVASLGHEDGRRDRDSPADPDAAKYRNAALRPLNRKLQQDYIDVELPSGTIDGAYSQVVATLSQGDKFAPGLAELARRIVRDGMEHAGKFLAIKSALQPYDERQYLRTAMRLGTRDDKGVQSVLEKRDSTIQALENAYKSAASGDVSRSAKLISGARLTMTTFLTEGEELAKQDIGIPFFLDLFA
jgi:hypothetical protein